MSIFRQFFFFVALFVPMSLTYSYTLENSISTTKTFKESVSSKHFDSEIENIEEEYSLFLTLDSWKLKKKGNTVIKGAVVASKNNAIKPIVINNIIFKKNINKKVTFKNAASNYWKTVYAVESRQGLLLYRPGNKSKNCNRTRGACGHHQLTVDALKDIGCKSAQCKIDREDYSKSLKMSKKLLKLNEKRLLANGYGKLPEYQRYLIHQQGAAGIKAIIKASRGTRILSNKIKRNMANNSPYSYRKLKNMGSKDAANLFMRFWKNKWEKEKRLVITQKKAKEYLLVSLL